MKYTLYDEKDYPIFFLLTDDNINSISSNVFQVISWKENNIICESKYFADVFIKYDGCSHWNFKGEDYIINPEEGEDMIDAYYHICGVKGYKLFIIGILFAFKVATLRSKYFDPDEIKDFKEFEFLINDYKIIEEK